MGYLLKVEIYVDVADLGTYCMKDIITSIIIAVMIITNIIITIIIIISAYLIGLLAYP